MSDEKALETTVTYVPMPRMRESLAAGLVTMRERMNAVDVEAPEAKFALAGMVLVTQKAQAQAEKGRTEEGAKVLERLEAIRALWRPLVDGFKALRGEMNTKYSQALSIERRREEEDRKAKEAALEAERARQAAQEARRTAGEAVPKAEAQASLLDLRKARQAVDALPPAGAPKGVKLDNGTVSEALEWTYEVVDLAQVPLMFTRRALDEAKVEAAIKGGLHDIKGLRIFQKPAVTARGGKR